MQFETINNLAKKGFITEYRLRQMKKEGKLPGVYAGTRFYVNVEALIELLNEECARNSGMA